MKLILALITLCIISCRTKQSINSIKIEHKNTQLSIFEPWEKASATYYLDYNNKVFIFDFNCLKKDYDTLIKDVEDIIASLKLLRPKK